MRERRPILSMGIEGIRESTEPKSGDSVQGDSYGILDTILGNIIPLKSKPCSLKLFSAENLSLTVLYFNEKYLVGISSSDPRVNYWRGRFDTLDILYTADRLMREIDPKSKEGMNENEYKLRVEEIAKEIRPLVIEIINQAITNNYHFKLNFDDANSSVCIPTIKMDSFLLNIGNPNSLEKVIDEQSKV